MAVDTTITEGEGPELGLHFDVVTAGNVLVDHAFAEAVGSPWDGWALHWTEERHPHSNCAHVPPSDPCT